MEDGFKSIVVVGSINTDLVVTADRLPCAGETVTGSSFATYQGGKGANQAVAAARLGAKVVMLGMVGSDAFGSESIRRMKESGVDCQHVGVAPGPSGIAVITVGADGQNTIVLAEGANAAVTPEFVEFKRWVIRGAGMVLTQLEIPVETVMRLAEICREEGVPLMLDPAPAREIPHELLRLCTWFTPNETEASFFAEKMAGSTAQTIGALRSMGVGSIVLKLGEGGVEIDSLPGDAYLLRPPAVKAIDTTAAGDTFNGAFATALCAGESIRAAGEFAVVAAALSVTRMGAQASMPGLQEVREAMLKHENDHFA